MASEATTLSVPGPNGVREMRLSSPSRVMYPADGITKLELAEYVLAVGDALVRAIGDRPIALQRFGDGIHGDQFFSKNPPKGKPEFIREVMVTYPSARAHPQLVIDEPAAAIWMVQMNTVVFHPWPSRASDIDHPDQLRIDLDPQPGTDFADAVPAAHELRKVLAEAGLDGVPQDLGQSGTARVRADPTRARLHRRAACRHRRRPRARPEDARAGDDRVVEGAAGERIFVDFNQAARDRTIAGAYSPRAIDGAPVSCPLDWDELDDIDPRALTVRTVPDRVRDHGDPWADMHAAPGSIGTLLEWWERDVANGEGEMPYPPDYPEDARGAAPRAAQPSPSARRRLTRRFPVAEPRSRPCRSRWRVTSDSSARKPRSGGDRRSAPVSKPLKEDA